MDLAKWIVDNKERVMLTFGFVLVFTLGCFSGYFYAVEKESGNKMISIKEPSNQCSDLIKKEVISSSVAKIETVLNPDALDSVENISLEKKGMFVASKNSKIFHKADCSYAQKIKEENKVWFASEKVAIEKGFSPHEHCFK